MNKIRKLSIFVLIIIFSVAFFHGCKKYEEGPSLSLRSKTSRLEGEWKVKKYLVNEEDNLSNYEKVESDYDYECSSSYTKTTSGTIEYKYEFDKNEDVYLTEKFSGTISIDYDYNYNCSDSSYSDSYTEVYFGEWEFKHDKEELRIEIYYVNSTQREDYEIVRLTNKELKLKGYFSGKKVEIQMEKL